LFKRTALFIAVAAASALADVTPAPLFTDHAVLQSGMSVPVWGKAEAGEHVTVTLKDDKGDHKAEADAGPDGKWMAKLDNLETGSPGTLTIAGKNTITLNDILVGEVWLASGQSNMQFGTMIADQKSVDKANDPELRLFYVPQAGSLTPLDYLKPDRPMAAKWVVCTRQNLMGAGSWGGFSAVGYFFGKSLREDLKRPVGVIESSWGGTRSQAWTSVDAFAADPSTKHYVDEIEKFEKRTDREKMPWFWADFGPEKEKWMREVGNEFNPKLKAWQEETKKAKAADPQAVIPPAPQPSRPSPDPHFQQAPGILYNAMIAPLVPYGIKGVIWYQGENNAGGAKEYRDIFPLMIADWRNKWGEGNFPFLFVQIAPFRLMGPQIREAQLMTLAKSPNTAMAVTTDAGDANDIHPKKKQIVGERLALAARALAYGEKIEYSGPLYDSVQFDGNKAIVHFTHVGGGLVAAGEKLRGFTIAGQDGKFVPADAEIAGDTVVVHADGVSDPKAVAYGWANVPDVNLYNKNGLPASPFRSNPD